jgi:16S rRNA (guanine1207-N2)-methyltransferase
MALAAALPARLGPRVADLGAGWGYLSRAILAREGVAEVHLIEADHAALACARANITDPRARFHWADAIAFTPDAPFDAVVTNPPFHVTRAASPDLGRGFIDAARRMLTPRGDLWLVANRHLPYEGALRAAFREVTEMGADPAFKVFHASHPIRSR